MIDDPDEVTVVPTPDPVVVEVRMPAEIDVIEVQVPGPQGPPGKDGSSGSPGAPGDGATDPGDLTLIFDNRLI